MQGLNKLKLILNIFFNLISLLLFIISYYFYFLSLEKCTKGDDECTRKWDWIKLKIMQFCTSAAIIIFLIILIIYKIISKFHLIHFVIAFIYFYRYSHSVFFFDHGGLNLFGLFFAIFASLIFIIFLKVFVYIFKIKYKYKIILIMFLLLCHNIEADPINCNDWAMGLNNTSIENNKDKYGCQIIFPKKCYFKIIQYTQDLSKLTRKSCKNKKKNARKNILKYSRSPYVNPNIMKFGFPLTNNDQGAKDGKFDKLLTRYTSHNIIDMDKNPNISPKPEYIVDFLKDPLGELTVNLNYNETLSRERKKLENDSIPYYDNILIIYVDSISRAHVLRKMKKTVEFFEKFISYKGGHHKKYPTENFHSFQFFKYYAFEGYTPSNFPRLFYGKDQREKNLIRITRYIRQNGYVTCYSTDICMRDNTRIRHELTRDSLYDHQLLLCDPNTEHSSFITKKCLYGNINAYYLIDYINQFWRKYKNNRKFAVYVSNDSHEGTMELIKYTDEVIYNLLNSLYNDNLLKDSSIFLLSDHGVTNPSIYFLYDFFQIEKRLPALFIIFNDKKNLNYNQQYFNIHENQQTFITAYDIYNTIGNIIYGDKYVNIQNKDDRNDTPKSPKGQSLFELINPKERRPQNYNGMSNKFCV